MVHFPLSPQKERMQISSDLHPFYYTQYQSAWIDDNELQIAL